MNKTHVKTPLSFLLSIVIIVSSCPISAFADNEGGKTSWWNHFINDASNAAQSAESTVENAYDSAANVADKATQSAKKAMENLSLPDFKKGWNMTSSFFSTNIASFVGYQYVDDVAAAISKLQTNVNSRVQSRSYSIAQKAGFVAEEWHAGTYNIDAVAKNSKKMASALDSNKKGSVDVAIDDDVLASMKYYSTAEKSAKAQAIVSDEARNALCDYTQDVSNSGINISFDDWLIKNSNKYPELEWAKYSGQLRVIPKDQLNEATEVLKKAIAKETAKGTSNRDAVAKADLDTLKNLVDKLETADGTKSTPLNKNEAEAIAKCGMSGDFKPEDFGITTAKSIKGNYIAKEAIKAGASAAIIQTALVVGPEIFEIIKYMIETGEIDKEQLKKTGIDGFSAAADGYLKGSISNALIIMCKSGKLGVVYTNASPELIGALTVLVIDAIRYGIKMANGNITTAEYADIMAEELVVSAAALGSASLVGMLFPGAILAICLGSFVGGLVASMGYTAGKTVVLAKIDNGGVDMLVPIQSTAESLKGKSSIISSKISDALNGIKGIDVSSVRDKTIKVFDFST